MSAGERKPTEMYLLRRRKLTVVISLLMIAAAVALPLTIWLVLHNVESDGFLLLFVMSLVWALNVLVISGLNLRNAFYPYIMAATAEGIYDYSGFIHGGFIAWEDIERITLGRSNTANDMANAFDGNSPCIRIYIKNFEAYFARQGKLRRIFLILGGGCIKLQTMLAKAKRSDVYDAIYEFSRHYLTDEGGENGKG